MIIASESLVAMLKPTYWQFKLEVKIPRWRLLSQGRFNIIDLYLLDDSEMPAVGYSETFSMRCHGFSASSSLRRGRQDYFQSVCCQTQKKQIHSSHPKE